MERSLKRPASLALALGLLGPAATPAKAAEPGGLIAVLPSSAPGPMDIALDPESGTYWVTSHLEHKIYRFRDDLRQEIEAFPVPFQNILGSQATGIAYDPRSRTLFVAETGGDRIYEIERDGTPTGRALSVPPLAPSRRSNPGGLAFDPDGDGGLGALFVAVGNGETSRIYEMSLQGAVLRSFPEPDALERVLGTKRWAWSLSDVEPIREAGRLSGFYVTAGGDNRNAILKLDAQGSPTGVSISLAEARNSCDGVLRRRFPHPETGQAVDAFVLTQSTGSRFVILQAGEPSFHEILDLRCEQTGRKVALSWSAVQTYDVVDILRGCEALASLPGNALRWEAELALDGVYDLGVRAVKGFNVTQAGPCTVVVGPGQVLASARHGSDAHHGVNDPRLAALLREDLLVVNDRRGLRFFDLSLKPLGTAAVSDFFFQDPEDQIAALAEAGEPQTLYLFRSRQQGIGKVDLAGNLLDSFDVELPNLEKDPGQPPRRGTVVGLVFNSAGDAGRGSFWVHEADRRRLYELDRSGKILRESPHPYSGRPLPSPGGAGGRGLAPVEGTGFGEVYLSGRLTGYFQGTQHVLRMDLTSGAVVPGSEIPFPRGLNGVAHTRSEGRSRLFVLSGEEIMEIQAEPSSVPPPTLLLCRQPSSEDQVELSFRNNGPYDVVEVSRDCEKIAAIDGSASLYLDRMPQLGFHEYAVRGVRGGQASDFARCRLQVGPGAILEWKELDSVRSPGGQITAHPTTGELFLVGDERRLIYRLDRDMNVREARPTGLPEPWALKTLAVRAPAEGESLLFAVAGSALRAPGESFLFGSETLDGRVQGQAEIALPRDRFGTSEPVGLSWDPQSDTFYLLESRTETFLQVDLQGNTIRTLPHPAPPGDSFIQNDGFTFAPDRRSLLTTALPLEDLVPVPNCGYPCPTVSRVIEVDLQGRPTGYSIPLRRELLNVSGIAVVGRDLIVFSNHGGGAILRLKAFPEGDGGGFFIRGDVNLDGRVDISDPVALLGHLFLGGARPGCLDAADGDDSGLLDLTDGISVLGFLFLGGAPPPPPFPGRGTDPTADGLDCARAP